MPMDTNDRPLMEADIRRLQAAIKDKEALLASATSESQKTSLQNEINGMKYEIADLKSKL